MDMPDIKLNLSADARKQVGLDLLQKIRDSRQGMAPLLRDVEKWRKRYESELPDKSFPWPDCSNLNVPITQTHVDTYKAHIKSVITSVSPYVLVSTSSKAKKAKAGLVQRAVHNMQEDRMKLSESLNDTIQESLIAGTCVGKVVWREDYRTVRDEEPETDPLGMPVIGPDGRPAVKLVEKEEPRYRGPKVELVDLDNFVVYPLTVKDAESATLIGDKYRLTADEIRRRVKKGIFDADAANSLLDAMGNEQGQTETSEEYKDSIDGISKVDFGELWFWEVIAPYDYNKDGLQEDCLFVLEEKTGTIVRAIQFPYWHGRRYYVPIRPFPRAKRFFGRALPKILEGVQDELNAVHNQRVDATTIAMTKAFKTRNNSGIDMDAQIITPGAVIPMKEMDDLQEIDINPLVPGVDVEQISRDWGERASGVTDIASGKGTEEQKTLGEVRLVSAQGGARFSDTIEELQASTVEITEQVMGLMYQYMTDEELNELAEVELTPETTPDHVLTRADLRDSWKLKAHGNTGTANKMQQRDEALGIYDKLMENPLVMNNPVYIHRVTADLLNAYDRTDVESYIGSEEELKMMMEQFQQEEEMAAEQQAMMQEEQMAMQAEGEQARMMNESAEKQADREHQMNLAAMKQQGPSNA
jgi:hypothetical protein